MPKPRALTREEAKRALAHRLGRRVDRVRQIATRVGIRPYRVFLVWTKFQGKERGEGKETRFREVELLPTPKVDSLDNINFSPVSVGMLPVGSVRLSRVSVTYTEDELTGKMVHDDPPEPYDFYYEIVEDGRGDSPAERRRFRVAGSPNRHAGGVHWQITLERTSQDNNRDGTSSYGDDD